MVRVKAETTNLGPRGRELAEVVSECELLRLLELPRGRALDGELGARVDAARSWYAVHGRPFAAARRVEVRSLTAAEVRLVDGSELRSGALAARLRSARGHAVVVLAVSAGPEVARETGRLWADGRPDEAYFLDRFAAAVAEALVSWSAAAACREAAGEGETLLPPLSPGCSDFALGDQQRLMALLGATQRNERAALGPLELVATGALDPPHSLLAALGVTRQKLAAATPDDLCRGCGLERCRFRRAPHAAAAFATPGERA
jgi:hypothetical protein